MQITFITVTNKSLPYITLINNKYSSVNMINDIQDYIE